MLWAKTLQRSDTKKSPFVFKKSSYSVIFFALLCIVGSAEVQPTPEASTACGDARYYISPREDYLRGDFFLLMFKFISMKKKKFLKMLAQLIFALQLEQAKNAEKKVPCILQHLTLSCCLENAQFLEEFVRNHKKEKNGK